MFLIYISFPTVFPYDVKTMYIHLYVFLCTVYNMHTLYRYMCVCVCVYL